MELVREKVEHLIRIGKFDYRADNNELSVLQAYLAYAINTAEPHQFLGRSVNGENRISIYWKDEDIFIVDLLEQESQEISCREMQELSYAIQVYSENSNYTPAVLLDSEYWEQNDHELFWHRTRDNVITQVYCDNKEASDLEYGLWLDEGGCCWGVKAKYSGEEGDIVGAYFFDETCSKNIL